MTTYNDENIGLRPLQPDQFVQYRESFIRDWADDIARVDDIPLAEATIQATKRTDSELTDGATTKGHYLYAIVRGDEWVGTLWFSAGEERNAFLDDITVREAFRGKGYGRRALELFEARASELGLTRIDLHVYRHNPRAISLYEKLGYRTTGLKMRKVLGAK
jgi:ribosomal protein S18 acetylase RimI-like enzyme